MSADFAFGPFVLDVQRGIIFREGRPLALSGRGLKLLQALVASPGEVVTKAALMQAAWGDAAVEESNLSVQMAALRKQLGPADHDGEWIVTVPRAGYRFVGNPGARSDALKPPSPQQTRRPSIAILPFLNLSGEVEQEYMADGITEDIITALTRFRWFFVAARHSSFVYKSAVVDAKQIARELDVQYLLEGSVRRSGQHVRISAQLIDSASGNHIWAERYDLELTEVFAIQDEIAERVVGAIEPELLKTEGAMAAAHHTGNMTAWDLVRRGTWHFHQVTRENHLEARELFRQACALDPDLPEAHLWLARVNAGIVPYGWSSASAADLKEGTEAAIKAVQLDGRNPYSHYALAIISVFSEQFHQAIGAARKAIDINPTFALGHMVLGMGLLFDGHAAEAIAPLERGLRLNPNDPQNFVWFNLLALARLFSGDPEAALESARQALHARPDWWTSMEVMLCCHAALGNWDEAKQYGRRLANIGPRSGDVIAPLRARNPEWARQISSFVRQASD